MHTTKFHIYNLIDRSSLHNFHMKNKTKMKTRNIKKGYTYLKNVKNQLYFENIGSAKESRSSNFTTSHHISIAIFFITRTWEKLSFLKLHIII